MKIESNINPEIIAFLNKNDFFDSSLDESKLDFSFKKITSAIKADEIYNFMLDDSEAEKIQEWDIVRSSQIINMEERYSGDPYELIMEIFKYVSRKLKNSNIKDKALDERIPYLIDSINDDFCKIIFNEYCSINNQFFNNLLQVYLAGGWPCGWEGQYPKGKLVIFSNE